MKESIFLPNLSDLLFNLIPLVTLEVKAKISYSYSYCMLILITLSCHFLFFLNIRTLSTCTASIKFFDTCAQLSAEQGFMPLAFNDLLSFW